MKTIISLILFFIVTHIALDWSQMSKVRDSSRLLIKTVNYVNKTSMKVDFKSINDQGVLFSCEYPILWVNDKSNVVRSMTESEMEQAFTTVVKNCSPNSIKSVQK